MKLKIIFLRAYDFPIGGASQNRLLGICKGLIEQGHIVEVHQYTPARLNIPLNLKAKQVYNTVPIYNHAWRWSPANNRFNKVIGIIAGLISTLIALVKSTRKSHINFIFINTDKFIYLFPFFIFSRLIGTKLGRDLCEYPIFILKPKNYNKLYIKLKKSFGYRWLGVLLVITNFLKDYYAKHARTNTKIFLLPMTVDIDRFPFRSENFINSNNITYCGDLSQEKDGVLTLIESFALIANQYPRLLLKLVGHNKNRSHIENLHKKIQQLNLSERVVFTGFIDSEVIPKELYDSRILVLSRPANIQAQGGFPTKLGEYLATGIPVVVTKVGEIPLYLKDEENAFLSEPDSIESFAESMKRSLNNVELSKKVGKNGRETAIKYFSHKEQGKELSKFLISNK